MFGGARRVVYITQNIAGLHNLEYSGHPYFALAFARCAWQRARVHREALWRGMLLNPAHTSLAEYP